MTYSINELQQVAKSIVEKANSRTLCFYGEMGAGKTTLIKALVKVLGGTDSGSSPTFGIVNEYQLESGELLGYHFDFYRLNDEMEALDLGFEEYLNKHVWVFIEWPENIASFLPDDAINIHLKISNEELREITIS